jgi:2-iminobutanoate/2-iminopropanoate deaminase
VNARRTIDAPGAPAMQGPYSHAVQHGDLLFCSGMIPLDPASGDLVTGSPGAETELCLRNLEAICEAAGTDLSRAIRVTIFMTDVTAYEEINLAYGRFFADSPPARMAIGAAALPKGAGLEIEAIVSMVQDDVA